MFGAAVPERNPRTRSARALKFRVIGDLGSRDAMHADYRYFRDTWEHQGAHRSSSATAATSATPGSPTRSCATTRRATRSFYSDNAQSETLYVSRNRQLSTFDNMGLGASSPTPCGACRAYDLKLNGAYEYTRFKFKDFTDIRTGSLYGYNASVIQLYLSATY